MDSDGKAVMGKEKEGLVDEDGKIRRDGLKDERTEFQKSYVYYDSITGNPRVNRKPLMQSPWVLLGFGATVAALLRGLHYFRKADSRNQQLMMRARVGAQALTVFATMYAVKPVPLSAEQKMQSEEEYFTQLRIKEIKDAEAIAALESG